MNKQEADQKAKEIAAFLAGKQLTAVEVHPRAWAKVCVRTVTFDKCYVVEYKDGGCAIGLCDSYGIMCGSDKWTITETSVIAETTNAYNETLFFCWAVSELAAENAALRVAHPCGAKDHAIKLVILRRLLDERNPQQLALFAA